MNCIERLLKYILILQINSDNNHKSLKCNPYNTRLISIYNKDGSLLSINNITTFRINKIKDNSINLLLVDNTNKTYTSTNVYASIPISCIGAIRCIEDIILNNI